MAVNVLPHAISRTWYVACLCICVFAFFMLCRMFKKYLFCFGFVCFCLKLCFMLHLVWHNVKCAVCKAQPIRGLRYRCLRCMGYEQCQTCFLTGKANRKHKLSHPMQEYVAQVCDNFIMYLIYSHNS